MPTITPDKPLYLADSIITLGGDDYQAAISSAVFTPSTPAPQVFKGLTPTARYKRQGLADWTLDLGYVQDPDDEDSLSNYLHDHEGEEIDAVIEPNDGGSSWAAKINVAAGSLGGAVETYGTSTVSCSSTKPARTAAPVVP